MTVSFKLKSSPKLFRNYKSETPSRTISKIEKALQKLGLDLNNIKYKREKVGEGFSIYSEFLNYSDFYVSSGKGLSRQLSKASALAEAVERIPPNISPLIPYLKLKTDIMEGSDFKGYVKGNQKKIKNSMPIKNFLPHFPKLNLEEFKEEKLADTWIDAFSLTENKYKKVPHLAIRKIAGSNGLAAGNTLEEAISQAFCEVCERHSLIEHLLNKLPTPTIKPDSLEDKNILKSINVFRSLNIETEIKDFSIRNKIPVMGVLFKNRNLTEKKGTLRKQMFGRDIHVGSHIDLNQAIMRCFVEQWQTGGFNHQVMMYHREFDVLELYLSEKEKKKVVRDFKKDFKPFVTSNRSFEDFEFIDKNRKEIPLGSLSSHNTDNFLKDIEVIKEIAKKNKWEILIIDYSIPELPLKVVRVIVPQIADDLIRYKFINPEKITTLNEGEEGILLEDVLKDKKTDIKYLISVAESNLIEGIVSPHPKRKIFGKYLPLDILRFLKEKYSEIGNKQKVLRIKKTLNYFTE